jgi:uncharacterized protein YkwD
MEFLDAPPACTDAVQIESDGVQSRWSRLFGALLTAASLLFAATPAHGADCAGASSEPSAIGMDATVSALECEVNAARADRGLRPLRTDSDLGDAARRHAADMVRRGYFAHVSPGGSDLGDRLRRAGYGHGDGWRAGEALAWGTGDLATPEAIVNAWLNSPPHRRILLDTGFREFGVGVASGDPGTTDSSLPGATYALEAAVIR